METGSYIVYSTSRDVPSIVGVIHVAAVAGVTMQSQRFSVVLSKCSVVLLQDNTTGRLCRAVPVLCEPMATEQSWVAEFSR